MRRDVVVFNPPEAYTDLTGNTEALIKRIVAVAGDTIEVKGSKLYVNGQAQEEPYTNERPDYSLEPIKVPVGCVLVLGQLITWRPALSLTTSTHNNSILIINKMSSFINCRR